MQIPDQFNIAPAFAALNFRNEPIQFIIKDGRILIFNHNNGKTNNYPNDWCYIATDQHGQGLVLLVHDSEATKYIKENSIPSIIQSLEDWVLDNINA